MRPMILTLPDGSKRRFNPFQIMGWREAEMPHPSAPGRVFVGTSVIMPGGPVGVMESEAMVDWLFCLATGEPFPRPDTPVRADAMPVMTVAAPETTASVKAPIPTPARKRRER